jgi:hypothetical protein
MIESIEFDSDLFNEVFYEIKECFDNPKIRYCYLYGGSSSSKTYTLCQNSVIFLLEGKRNNVFVIKKIAEKIETTIFADFKEIIEDWGLKNYFIIQKNYIECKLTGSYISFSGLYDVDDLKGLKGYKKLIVDELDKIDFSDFKQLKKRLRGIKGQQYYFTFNPVSEQCYIKVDIFDKDEFIEIPCKAVDVKQINKKGNTLVYRTNYLFNKWIVGDGKGGGFIDQHVIDDFESDKVNDINYYNIYALGHWGKLRTGGEFLKQFKYDKHCGVYPYNPDLPLHIVFDENVLPYVTCNVYQLQNNILTQIDEIMLEDPRNTLKETCEEFIKRYGSNGQGLFVYGDATSKKNDSKLQKGYNFYKLIQNYLSLMRPTFKVPMANPAVINSKQFVNDIFLDEVDGVQLRFDVNCKKSINDYQYCTEDADGKVNKSTIKNKLTGQSYQQYGHACDALRYIVYMIYHKEYRNWIVNGAKKIN